MEITKEEEKILEGKYGDTARKLLEISLRVGEAKGAERMIDIKSVHGGTVGGYREGPGSWDTAGIELLEALAESGLKFKVPFSTNVIGMDLCQWQDMGIPEDFAKTQMRAVTAFSKLGAIPGYTCLPYLEENVPKMGDHVAWVETGTVTMVNSYIGARSNREVDLTALAAAITGRTAEYGLHLKENRYGDILVKADTDLNYADLGALGFCAGKTSATIPVFDGLQENLNAEEIQQLFGVLAMVAPIALAHIVGVTPEATTLAEAFGGKEPKETFIFGRKELTEAYEALSTAKGREVDFVVIGCHFCTLDKLRKIARLLDSKKVHENASLWVQTSSTIRNLAERDGCIREIERAGAKIYCDACVLVTSIKKYYGFKVMATDSAKMAFAVQGTPYVGMDTLYGSTEKCIEAALTGRW